MYFIINDVNGKHSFRNNVNIYRTNEYIGDGTHAKIMNKSMVRLFALVFIVARFECKGKYISNSKEKSNNNNDSYRR